MEAGGEVGAGSRLVAGEPGAVVEDEGDDAGEDAGDGAGATVVGGSAAGEAGGAVVAVVPVTADTGWLELDGGSDRAGVEVEEPDRNDVGGVEPDEVAPPPASECNAGAADDDVGLSATAEPVVEVVDVVVVDGVTATNADGDRGAVVDATCTLGSAAAWPRWPSPSSALTTTRPTSATVQAMAPTAQCLGHLWAQARRSRPDA